MTAHWSKQFSSSSQERRLPWTRGHHNIKNNHHHPPSPQKTNIKVIMKTWICPWNASWILQGLYAPSYHSSTHAPCTLALQVANGTSIKSTLYTHTLLTISLNSCFFGGSHSAGRLEYLQGENNSIIPCSIIYLTILCVRRSCYSLHTHHFLCTLNTVCEFLFFLCSRINVHVCIP